MLPLLSQILFHFANLVGLAYDSSLSHPPPLAPPPPAPLPLRRTMTNLWCMSATMHSTLLQRGLSAFISTVCCVCCPLLPVHTSLLCLHLLLMSSKACCVCCQGRVTGNGVLDFSGMHLAVLSVAGVITSVGGLDIVPHCFCQMFRGPRNSVMINFTPLS